MSRFDRLRGLSAAAVQSGIAGIAGAIADEFTDLPIGTGVLLMAPFAAGHTVYVVGPKNQPPTRYILTGPVVGGATASATYFTTRAFIQGMRSLYR